MRPVPPPRPVAPAVLAALLVAAALTAAVSAAASEPVAADTPALPRHELIFARHSDAARQDYDVWRMCADGTQLASLVVLPEDQIQLAVSPNGDELLYTTIVDGVGTVWRRPFGRSEAVKLSPDGADDGSPAWSPDGRKVAFTSQRDAAKPDLYLVDLESGEVRRLTDDGHHDSGAAWAPDGSHLVFTRFFPRPEDGEHEGDGEIIRLDLASGEERQLTRLGGYNGGLSYSPDGSTLAFHRVADERSEIWLMDADGGSPRAITDTFVDEWSPEWSPDGHWLAVSVGVGHDGMGTFDLWLLRPDGSDRRLLNAAGNTEAWHKWRPGEHYCR